jgi:hypothetical protein
MLISERIKISEAASASAMRSSAAGPDWANSMNEPAGAEFVPEVLAEKHFDVRLIVNHENEQVHARPPD